MSGCSHHTVVHQQCPPALQSTAGLIWSSRQSSQIFTSCACAGRARYREGSRRQSTTTISQKKKWQFYGLGSGLEVEALGDALLLLVQHLLLGLLEVHMRHAHAPLAQRQQARLRAHRLDVRTRQFILPRASHLSAILQNTQPLQNPSSKAHPSCSRLSIMFQY